MTLYNRYHIEWADGNVETFETSGERSARISTLEDVGYTCRNLKLFERLELIEPHPRPRGHTTTISYQGGHNYVSELGLERQDG